MQKKKMLFIGWDAFDWEVADLLMADGKMPVLSGFLKSGVKGNIATLSPTLSPVLWTSIATGKRAYDHGIKGFVEVDPLTSEVYPVRTTSRKVKAFWNILNEAGLKTNVVNWWPSYPPEKLDGVVVTNHFHRSPVPLGTDWPIDKSAVHPERYLHELKDLRLHPGEITLAHIEPFIPDAAMLDPNKDPVLNSAIRILAHTCSIHNAATYLMEKTDWDLMAVYQESIDHYSHLAMKYHPPRQEGVGEEEFKRYCNIVEGAYRFHDMMLDRMLTLAGPDCDVMIVSDHGFHSGRLRAPELPDVPAAPALEHRKYGVFACAGPTFNSDFKIYGSSLLDITPTLLHYFGLPAGDDMEGKVLHKIFQKEMKVSTIPSWEITGKEIQWEGGEGRFSQSGLEDLEKIGYIDLPETGKEKYVTRELDHNLIVSLIEGNKLEHAHELAHKNWDQDPELRFGVLRAEIAYRCGKPEELERVLAEMEHKKMGHTAVTFFRGLSALQRNNVEQALEKFDELEAHGIISVQLFNQIAQVLLISGREEEAKSYFEKSLAEEPNNAQALTGKAHALTELGNTAEALPILERSLELMFFQPNAHYLMALSANENGYREVALNAVEICLMQAPGHQKALKLHELLKGEPASKDTKPVFVVSGFPRSGTSLLMKMLREAGLDLYTDDHRQADDHNPEGYFEHEKVKSLGRDNSWVKDSRGRVLKVVTPLLRYLPAGEHYKIIRMNRPLTETILSQEIMRGRKKEEVMRHFPFQMAVEFQKEDTRIENWLKMQPHMDFVDVGFYDCLREPEQVLRLLEGFLQRKLDIKGALQAINPKLHRNKLGSN